MNFPSRRSFLRASLAGATAIALPAALRGAAQNSSFPRPDGHHVPPWRLPVAGSAHIRMGTAALQVDFGPGKLAVPQPEIVDWVRRAAEALVTYYGTYPVPAARIYVQPAPGNGVFDGTTWGDVGGVPAFTRIQLGEQTTLAELQDDWMMTHEMVHYALPSLPDDQHWLEEGLAVYVEPIARVQAGQLDQASVWRDMMRDMPKGQPRPGEGGLDVTHTWGRTYWGGAGFCLLADVTLRRQTGNRSGLQQGLRALVGSGQSIALNRDILPTLQLCDHATGTSVLTTLYQSMREQPAPIDFDGLWRQLGVSLQGDTVQYQDAAPLAAVRRAIFTRPA
ncbi:MAG: hypothetical protein KGK08_03785 [Acidobacteriota bacterium]|nr:hypothetical protein [Acidobacteriota bacterium]